MSGALLGCTCWEQPSTVSRVRGTNSAFVCFEDPPLALQLLGAGGLHLRSRSTMIVPNEGEPRLPGLVLPISIWKHVVSPCIGQPGLLASPPLPKILG